jgi:ferredoxin--NADP+ reductase
VTGRLEELAGAKLTPEASHVMLCGNPGLVEEMTARLEERGFRKNRRQSPGQVTSERYW